MVLCLADELDDVFESLTKAQVQVVGESHWRKLSMFLKAFLVTQPLMGELVPQMMNLELIYGSEATKVVTPAKKWWHALSILDESSAGSILQQSLWRRAHRHQSLNPDRGKRWDQGGFGRPGGLTKVTRYP